MKKVISFILATLIIALCVGAVVWTTRSNDTPVKDQNQNITKPNDKDQTDNPSNSDTPNNPDNPDDSDEPNSSTPPVKPDKYIDGLEYAFFVDGVSIAKGTYDSNADSIPEPDVPKKLGYIGRWDDYVLNYDPEYMLAISAIYIPIEYSISFVADGKTVSVEHFTVENMDITVPSVPIKSGYTGQWESYSLNTYENKTVNAIYTAIHEISGYTKIADWDFRTLTDISFIEGHPTGTCVAAVEKTAEGIMLTAEKQDAAHWFFDITDLVVEGKNYAVATETKSPNMLLCWQVYVSYDNRGPLLYKGTTWFSADEKKTTACTAMFSITDYKAFLESKNVSVTNYDASKVKVQFALFQGDSPCVIRMSVHEQL